LDLIIGSSKAIESLIAQNFPQQVKKGQLNLAGLSLVR
jgi:hypothetical protein